MQTIDCTPTWAGLLPALLTAHENGSRKGAGDELRRMAQLADLAGQLIAAARATRASQRLLASEAGDVPEWNEGGHAYEAAQKLRAALEAAGVQS